MSEPLDLDAIEARASAATEGPWRWRNTQQVYLFGSRSRVVMAFERMGMQGAQPLFRDERNVLHPAGRANLYDFPDAVFIAHAREDVSALVAEVRASRDALALVHELTERGIRMDGSGYRNAAVNALYAIRGALDEVKS